MNDIGRRISVVMPVHDTDGAMLRDAVRSVLAQTWFAAIGADEWELIVVDDASRDADTLDALRDIAAMSSNVRVVPNVRNRGVAGARNTGVFAARGRWIGFLDSDDLWYPDFLARQAAAFASLPDALWRSAHFHAGDADARPDVKPLAQRSPYLHSRIADDYRSGCVSRLSRPIDVLLRGGCSGIMTVQVDRALLWRLGGFDERYQCAEDFDLWLRLAAVEDLYIAPIDAGIYRMHPGSLTRSARPMYFHEDRMLLSLRRNPAFGSFRRDVDQRLRMIYAKFCYDYREKQRYLTAASYALRLVRMKPRSAEGWRQLAASTLRR